MPCFLARQRSYIFEDGISHVKTFEDVEYPASLTLEVEITPKELFGPSEIISPRVTMTVGDPTKVTFDGATGRVTLESDVFLSQSNIVLNWNTLNDRRISILGNKLTYNIIVNSAHDVHVAVDFILYTITSSL